MPTKKVVVIDGMAVVQEMGKPPWIKTCAQWADHFTAALDSKTKEYSKIHVVFDHYYVPHSLKEATRERRQVDKPPATYHVEDSTPVGKVSAKQLCNTADL